MKKILTLLLISSVLSLLSSCSNKKDDLLPVSIGNLSFHYDATVWKHREKTNENTPLEFSDEHGNLISIFASQESTYQHPKEMIKFFETMVSASDGYEVFLEPTEIDVNGTTWYEYGYSYKEGTTIHKVYQRYYGKYYNAASISYTSTEKNYESGYDKAIVMMSDIKTTDVTNEENEAKAHKFLVGEWDLEASGYLALNDNGTYEWYKDNTKDKNNMHFGTYGCDVENVKLSLKEGDGLYLVLFPEGLVIDGTKEEPTSNKTDYLISLDKGDADGYPMVNMSSYSLYTMKKQ